jgi:hypothetical protein
MEEDLDESADTTTLDGLTIDKNFFKKQRLQLDSASTYCLQSPDNSNTTSPTFIVTSTFSTISSEISTLNSNSQSHSAMEEDFNDSGYDATATTDKRSLTNLRRKQKNRAKCKKQRKEKSLPNSKLNIHDKEDMS